MPALAELLGELLRGVGVLLRDQLGSISMIVTSEPKRRKIEANSQPMMPPPRTTRRLGHLGLGEQAGRVDAARRVEAVDRRAEWERAGRDDRLLEVTSSPPSTAIVFASLKRPVPLTHSTPFVLKRLATP